MNFSQGYKLLYGALLENVDTRESSSSSSSSHTSSILEASSNLLKLSSSNNDSMSNDSKESAARASSDSDNDSKYKKALKESRTFQSSSAIAKLSSSSGQHDEYIDEGSEEQEESENGEQLQEEENEEQPLKRRKKEPKAKKVWLKPSMNGHINIAVHPHASADKNSSSLKIASGKRVSLVLKNCGPFAIHDQKKEEARIPADDLMKGGETINFGLIILLTKNVLYVRDAQDQAHAAR